MLLALEPTPHASQAWAVTSHPLTLALAVLAGILTAVLERRLHGAPDFAEGLLVGLITALATVSLSCLVLLYGGEVNWAYPALILFVIHVPIAVIEGIVLGFAVAFLAKVKPEMLGPRKSWR
jgi:cobalt/nickel transport system permease protein